jgi:diaminohydroxyphosphoribosylaminopyrimidine deaminase/5-amino-6-(5-phosphoribosylamino)uracil reductase
VCGDDLSFMKLALAEAEKGRGAVEPNPMVGAVLVQNGGIVGIGHHGRFGGPHAEIDAIQSAPDSLMGATLYVTLEPCCHQGKTPPCTDAILAAGVSRVVAAIRDPFPRVDGGGLAILRAAGLEVELGILSGPAAELNAAYLKRVTTGCPYVTAKWAMTLDGKTAVASGQSQWISSSRSRALVHEVRGRMDAVVVGIRTVISDDPQLTVRPPGPRTPARVVLDSKATLPLASRLVQSARETPVLVVVTQDAPAERLRALERSGCEIIAFPGTPRVPITPLLAELGRREMTNVLVEGGGSVLGSFLEEGQIDEVDAFIAPILEGGDHAHTPARGRGAPTMSAAARLQRVSFSDVDGDLRVRGVLPQRWRSILDALGHEAPNRYPAADLP